MYVTCLFAAASGCAPPPYTATDIDGTEPAVQVTWPLPESTVTACTVVTVDVRNLTLTDFDTHLEDVPGEGHYHVTTPKGYTAVFTPYALITWLNEIPDSDDVLTVQLVNNLHLPLLDADGDTYEYEVPLHYMPGDACAEFGPPPTTGTDTGTDTAAAMDH